MGVIVPEGELRLSTTKFLDIGNFLKVDLLNFPLSHVPPNDARDATETFLLILPSFFYMCLAVLLSSLISPQKKVLAFIVEFLVIVIPIILNVTVFSIYVTNIVFIVSLILGLHLLITLTYLCYKPRSDIKQKKSNLHKKDYITNVRSTINIISVVAILAVDFKSFPSRFSKTSKTGFSLMDVGVGLYVFANGVVAPEVRGKKDPIKSSIKGSAILIIVGLLRLILTKLTHYHVSEIEYGVHWNFFITLGVTRILTSCLLNVVKVKFVFLNAICLTLAYETLLQLFLKDWIFSDDRSTLIAANKEGLVSTIGYIALYLFALYFSYNLKQTDSSYRKTNFKFFISCALALTVTYFCSVNLEVSRRLANAGYISWILFIGIVMMWLFYLAEKFQTNFFKHRLENYICAPYIYEGINYNGLLFFLIANVLTGLVNLSISTKKVDNFASIIILSVYMFINCYTVFVLYTKELRLKL